MSAKKSTYRPDADRVIWFAEHQADPDNDWSRVRASIRSYDGEPAKIALERIKAPYLKLGRLTRAEAETVRALLDRVIDRYDQQTATRPAQRPQRTTARSEARKRALGSGGRGA